MYTIAMKQLCYLSLSAILTLPMLVSADSHCPEAGEGALSYKLCNPLRFNSLESLIVGILNVLLVIAVPIIIFFIIFAGFSYVTAQGNPEKIKQASRSLTYAIIGGVLILGAVAISEILQSVVESFGA